MEKKHLHNDSRMDDDPVHRETSSESFGVGGDEFIRKKRDLDYLKGYRFYSFSFRADSGVEGHS